jgi:putative membrane protein insertion efficiency factor
MLLTLSFCMFLYGGLDDGLRADLCFITKANPIKLAIPAQREPADFKFRQVSELRLVLSSSIRFYQIFVSPQGPPGCNFTVTCSHFMTQAIQRYGLVHGLLMESDRLIRCNSMSRGHYTIDMRTGRAIDYPVDSYYLWAARRVPRRR